MPRIPTVSSDPSLSGGIPDGYASTPRLRGAEVGDAISGLGRAVTGLATVQSSQETANKIAQFDYSQRYLNQQTQAPPGAKGFQRQVGTDYDNAVSDYVRDIPDAVVRQGVKQTLMSRKPGIMSNAASFEVQSTAKNSKLDADRGLEVVENRVRADPQQYDQAFVDGQRIIDSRVDLPADLREVMKTTLGHNLAKRRFEVLGASVTTPEAVDGIVNELTKDDTWKGRMAPPDYDRILDQLKTTKKTIQTTETAEARAALESLVARNKDNLLIEPAEMAQVSASVRKSGNPALQWRWAEVEAQQDVLRQERHLPPSELRSRINHSRGEPGALYPSLPPQVSEAVQAGVDLVGGKVSAAYLAGTAIKEYGGQFKRAPSSADPQYKPQAANTSVDFRNISPSVIEAASVAGSIFGRPLVIQSGSTPTGVVRGMSLEVSTVGMTSEEKGKLTDALVQAGFTGFGETDTHIQADVRGSVPKSYGERDGKTWGGWTYLSPEVAASLKVRGFEGGLPSSNVNRYGAEGKRRDMSGQWQVDYGVKAPTSSATGLFQFIDETWLDVLRKNAQTLGVDPRMSDQSLLAMRRDPVLSAKAAALYAAENKRVVEASLGRTITDAELYMAHFLGGGGATAFLRTVQNNPTAAGADILPAAAKSNYSIFYDQDGGKRTVAEIYGNITASFMGAPSRMAHVRNEQRERMYKEQTERLKSDPMTYAAGNKRFTVSSLDSETGFANRGKEAAAVANYYNIPAEDMKPLTQTEAEGLSKRIKDGSADDVMSVMSQLQLMGAQMARAAYKQVGETDKVFEYAASLAHDRKQPGVAQEIIRGQKRIQENPDVKKLIGQTEQEMLTQFNALVGRAASGVSGRVMQQMMDAAFAHYVETAVTNGTGGLGKFDPSAYRQSIQTVMGGTKNAPAVDNVNGEPTVLPPGITADQMDTALDRATPDDYVRMSVDGNPPRYRDGTAIDPAEIAREGKFRAVGGNQYRIEMSDGRFAISTVNPNGTARPYLFNADPDELRKLLGRPAPASAPIPPQLSLPRVRARPGALFEPVTP